MTTVPSLEFAKYKKIVVVTGLALGRVGLADGSPSTSSR